MNLINYDKSVNGVQDFGGFQVNSLSGLIGLMQHAVMMTWKKKKKDLQRNRTWAGREETTREAGEY